MRMENKKYIILGVMSVVLLGMLSGCGVSRADAKAYDNQTKPIVSQVNTVVSNFGKDLKSFAADNGGQVGVMLFESKLTNYKAELTYLQNDVNNLDVTSNMKDENQLLSQSIDDSYNAINSFYEYLQTNDDSLVNGQMKTYSDKAGAEILQFRQTLDIDEGK